MGSTEDQRRQMAEQYGADPIGLNRQVVEEYRANGGRVERLAGTSRLLLLTTVGARSGRLHTAPMMYVGDGERLVVFASNAGSPRTPGWYHNLVAHPDVTVEMGSDRFDATAVVTAGEERARLWRLFPFPEHEDRARRQIPVVVLEPRRA